MVAKRQGAVKQEWKAREGSRLSDSDAAVIGPALERLAASARVAPYALTPEMVVDAAADEASPLHKYVYVADEEERAVRAFRLQQARTLIGGVYLIEITVKGKPAAVNVPGFYHIAVRPAPQITRDEDRPAPQITRDEDRPAPTVAYTATRLGIESPAWRQSVADDAERLLVSWAKRFAPLAHYPEFHDNPRLREAIKAAELG